MVSLSCFFCKKIIPESMMGKRVRCPYCSSKILYKARSSTTKVKAV